MDLNQVFELQWVESFDLERNLQKLAFDGIVS